MQPERDSRNSPCRCVRSAVDAGFSLVEILVVLGIILIIAAVATPYMTKTLDTYRIRDTMTNVASIAQRSRTVALKENTTQRLHVTKVNGQVVLFVTDSTDAAIQPIPGDPQLYAQYWLPAQFDTPGLPAGGPNNLTPLVMWGSNFALNGQNVNSDPYFNSRGMPCISNGGGPCTPTNGFVFYFRYNAGGSFRWTALSISPAARVQSWFWNGTAWGN